MNDRSTPLPIPLTITITQQALRGFIERFIRFPHDILYPVDSSPASVRIFNFVSPEGKNSCPTLSLSLRIFDPTHLAAARKQYTIEYFRLMVSTDNDLAQVSDRHRFVTKMFERREESDVKIHHTRITYSTQYCTFHQPKFEFDAKSDRGLED